MKQPYKRPEKDLENPPGQVVNRDDPETIRKRSATHSPIPIDPRFAAAHYQDGRDLFHNFEKPLEKAIEEYQQATNSVATSDEAQRRLQRIDQRLEWLIHGQPIDVWEFAADVRAASGVKACARCGGRKWVGDAWENEPCPDCTAGVSGTRDQIKGGWPDDDSAAKFFGLPGLKIKKP